MAGSTLDERRPSPASDHAADAFGPLISALIFGYYGFLDSTVRDTTDDAGNTVLLWLGSLWILRISALLFLASTALAFRNDRKTDLLYGASSTLATLGLLVILIWDQADAQYQTVFHPIILLICIAWNGYGAIQTLRSALRGI
ncbi:MAG: hypothetical protein RLZZ116_2282 [Planctomycetota bacterium]|jgi:hypothetical protein